jgi:O-antigen ligase
LFIFTFPFEATGLGAHSIAKLLGLFFFGIYLLHYNPLSYNRSFPAVPNAMWWFLGYVGVYMASVLRVPPELFREFVMRLLTLLQLLGFFWIASDLLKDGRMARSVLLTYLFSAALFAVGIVLRVPGFAEQVVEGRVTAAGENLNAVALHMAIAFLIAIGLILSKAYTKRTMNLLLASLTLPILAAMISTGSRGGIAAVVIGIGVYVLPYWKKKRPLAAIGFAAAGVIAVAFLVVTTPELLKRWQESYYEGELSDRENIFADSIQMISERPLLGWGAVEYGYELGFRGRSSDPNDTHNLIFHLLAELGILGTIPFLIGLCVILREAWRARSGVLGLLPLALMGAILAGNLSGNNLVWKPQWLVFALATVYAVTSNSKLWIRPAPRFAVYRKRTGDRPAFLFPGHVRQRSNAK